MTINGMELAFDMFDADTCERFEQAVEQVSQKAQALQKAQGLKASESIRAQCTAIFDCFNQIFGEGTDWALFGGKANLQACLKAFQALLGEVEKQRKEIEGLSAQISTPQPANRETRRATVKFAK